MQEKRKRPRRKPFSAQKTLTIHLDGRSKSGLSAKLIDAAAGGLRVELEFPVEEGAIVNVTGDIESAVGRQRIHGPCNVRWCAEVAAGKFVAGLSFLTDDEANFNLGDQFDSNIDTDFYEVLQLSRSADGETIRRIFHVMASRYHPDNRETGNPEMFRQIVAAHDVLSDPEKRAAFDARLANQSKSRLHLFRTWEESQGVEAEIRKRQGILRLLYGKRMTDSHAPSLSARDFEEMLGVPREHLEFSFWLLKENKSISRSDNNRFEITVNGVLAFEEEERNAARMADSNGYRGLMLEPASSRQ